MLFRSNAKSDIDLARAQSEFATMAAQLAAIRKLRGTSGRPVAFVDDYVAYLRGIPTEVHTALVLRAPNGSPNVGDELKLARSVHQDLAAFATHWLGS